LSKNNTSILHNGTKGISDVHSEVTSSGAVRHTEIVESIEHPRSACSVLVKGGKLAAEVNRSSDKLSLRPNGYRGIGVPEGIETRTVVVSKKKNKHEEEFKRGMLKTRTALEQDQPLNSTHWNLPSLHW
jgi:hypothetical protein